MAMSDRDTPLTFDPEQFTITGKSVSTSILQLDTDHVDAPELWDAFVAGFMCSGEGGNAEYPHSYDEGRVREAIREEFVEWVTSEGLADSDTGAEDTD